MLALQVMQPFFNERADAAATILETAKNQGGMRHDAEFCVPRCTRRQWVLRRRRSFVDRGNGDVLQSAAEHGQGTPLQMHAHEYYAQLSQTPPGKRPCYLRLYATCRRQGSLQNAQNAKKKNKLRMDVRSGRQEAAMRAPWPSPCSESCLLPKAMQQHQSKTHLWPSLILPP